MVSVRSRLSPQDRVQQGLTQRWAEGRHSTLGAGMWKRWGRSSVSPTRLPQLLVVCLSLSPLVHPRCCWSSWSQRCPQPPPALAGGDIP